MIAAEKVGIDMARFPELEVRNALAEFWKKQVQDREQDPFAPKSPPEGTVRDLLPALDSLTIVRSFIVIGKLLKIKIPVNLVKRGGYNSREEMLADLLPKLRKVYEKKINQKVTA